MGGTYAGAKVAVKELFEDMMSADDRKQSESFLNEAKILASVSHPHIVHFFGVAVHDSNRGRHFYIVTALKDESLKQMICREPKENVLFVDRLSIAWQISSALVFLHGKKII